MLEHNHQFAKPEVSDVFIFSLISTLSCCCFSSCCIRVTRDLSHKNAWLNHITLHNLHSSDICAKWFHDYWDQVIWDHIHMRIFLLRPHSFETTFIWDHSHLRPLHLRPYLFETTFIWDHIHLRPHSFETTSIWKYIHLRSYSFHAMLKWSCFDLLCITFYDLPFTSLRETWSFASWLFIWSFARLRPSVCSGDSRWFLNAPALRVGSRGGGTGVIDPGPSLEGEPVMIIICF